MKKCSILLIIAVFFGAALLIGCERYGGIKQQQGGSDPLTLGEKYLLDIDFNDAAEQFELLLREDPSEPRGYTGLAEAHIGLREYDEALDTLRDGYLRLSNSRTFLRLAVRLYEELIENDPNEIELYFELAALHTAMGGEDQAQDTLRRGFEKFPDDSRFKSMLKTGPIPEYEIKQTLLCETKGYDGTVVGRVEYWQPVFSGDGDNVRRMNEVFEYELYTMDEDTFDYVREEYNTGKGGVYDSITDYGAVAYLNVDWAEGWRRDKYISFYAYWDWYSFGAHGSAGKYGLTFDAESGGRLEMTDVFCVPASNLSDTLYAEYIAYHESIGSEYARLAREYPDSVKSQCGEHALFWIEDDGVHIFFEQYTFSYAAGMSELVIPLNRADLLRDPFVEYMTDF